MLMLNENHFNFHPHRKVIMIMMTLEVSSYGTAATIFRSVQEQSERESSRIGPHIKSIIVFSNPLHWIMRCKQDITPQCL